MDEIKRALKSYNLILKIIDSKDLLTIERLKYLKKELNKAMDYIVLTSQDKMLPNFLYEDDGLIKVGVRGDSEVTKEWNDYLNKNINDNNTRTTRD